MANFKDSPHFAIHDDYYTPKSAWTKLEPAFSQYPPGIKVWEACMLGADKSKSPEYIKSALTNYVQEVHYDTEMNCLTHQPDEEWDMIITNIPFNRKLKIPILKRFVELDKPFITLLNSCNLYSNYFREIFKDKFQHVQIIHPKGKINYDKLENGDLRKTKNASFYSVYLCYKMDIPNEKLYL